MQAIRHPMYTAILAWMANLGFVAANGIPIILSVGAADILVTRVLQVLLTRGLVVRSGQTRRVRYLLPLKQKVTPLHERDLSNQPARTLPVSRFRQISGERSSELEL